MSRYGTVLGGTANARAFVVQGADPDSLLAAMVAASAALAAVQPPLVDPVTTSLTLTGAGDGHTFVLEVEKAASANVDGGADVIGTPDFLIAATAEELQRQLAAIQSTNAILDVQIAGASKGQRVMAMVVFGTLRPSGGGGDHLVIVDPSDTTPGSLSVKLVGSPTIGLTTTDIGGGNLQMQAAYIGASLAQVGYASTTVTHTYNGPTSEFNSIAAILKDGLVPLEIPLSQVQNGQIVEIEWALGGDMVGPGPNTDVSIIPYVNSLATIVSGAGSMYIGPMATRYPFSGRVSFRYLGATADLTVGLAIRIPGGADSFLVYNSQIYGAGCNLKAYVWDNAAITAVPSNILVTPP
jgi:hypothetical protein